MFSSMVYFTLTFVQVWGKGHSSFFFFLICIFSCFRSICWKDFSHWTAWDFVVVENQFPICVDLLLSSILFIYLCILMLVPHFLFTIPYSTLWSWVVSPCTPTFFYQELFGYFIVLFIFMQILESVYQFWRKSLLGLWLGLPWILVWGELASQKYCVFLNMNRYISPFIYVFNFSR